MLKAFRSLPIVACMLLGGAAAADAQIYSWVENGTRKFSDEPPSDRVRTYKVIGTRAAIEATRRVDARYRGMYDALIEKHAATYAVSPDLVRAVIQVESGFNPRAVSPKGALGLMQLMPSTAIEMGVRDPFDPDENIRAGVAYLRQLLNRYPGDEQLALAAYNAGPEAVQRYGYQVPPYRETQRYVSRITGRRAASPVATPVITGKRASAPQLPGVVFAGLSGHGTMVYSKNRPQRAAKAPEKKPAAPVRIYKWWEKSADGRMIQKFSDTKPASGRYEVVR